MAQTAFETFNASIGRVELPALPGPTPKALFICGTPRSGTTILCQALSYCGEVGYIDNLIARFAQNPALGVLLSQSLDLPKAFTGRSDFGRTQDLTEPHEFGLGWSQLLAPSGIEQPALGTPLEAGAYDRLEQLIRHFGKPTVFKSFAYLWYITDIARALPDTLWLHIERDLNETSGSLEKLYRARADAAGTAPLWTSAVMQQTRQKAAKLALPERCLQQVTDIDAHIRASLATLPAHRTLRVSLHDYKRDPKTVVRSVFEHFDIAYAPTALEAL